MKPSLPLALGSLLLVGGLGIVGCRFGSPASPFASKEKVGRAGVNRFVTPANQILTPTGFQVELPGMRPQALALSPDGRILLASGKTAEIVVIDPNSGGVIRRRMSIPRRMPFRETSSNRIRTVRSASPVLSFRRAETACISRTSTAA